jgi:heat shock protein HslJ
MRKMTLVMVGLFMLAALVLSACSTNSEEITLAGTSWALVSYGPVKSQITAAEGVDAHLDFGTDGTFSGNMGCNSFQGEYIQQGSTITFDRMISTMMACEEPRMTQETTTFGIMNGKTTYEVQDGQLMITGSDGTSLMVLRPVVKATMK